MVMSYIGDRKLPELDALQQWSSILIEEDYILENLKIRYGINASNALYSVLAELYKKVALPRREIIEVLAFYLKESFELFKQEIMDKTRSAPAEDKKVLAIFLNAYRLRGGAPLDSTGLLQTCERFLGVSKDRAEEVFVNTGLVNKFWYESRRFSHPAWEAPPWVNELLPEIVRRSREYNLTLIDVKGLIEAVKEEEFLKELIRWIIKQFEARGASLVIFHKRHMKRKRKV
jgi:hypothetical protein